MPVKFVALSGIMANAVMLMLSEVNVIESALRETVAPAGGVFRSASAAPIDIVPGGRLVEVEVVWVLDVALVVEAEVVDVLVWLVLAALLLDVVLRVVPDVVTISPYMPPIP